MLLYGTGGGGWWRGPKSEPPIGGVRCFLLALWPALLTSLLTRQRACVCAARARSCACLAASRPSEMSRMSSTTRILVTPSSTRQSTRRAWSWQTQWPTASPALASHASPRGLPFCKHKGHEARRRGHGYDPQSDGHAPAAGSPELREAGAICCQSVVAHFQPTQPMKCQACVLSVSIRARGPSWYKANVKAWRVAWTVDAGI